MFCLSLSDSIVTIQEENWIHTQPCQNQTMIIILFFVIVVSALCFYVEQSCLSYFHLFMGEISNCITNHISGPIDVIVLWNNTD